jgi:hypothetical protein
MIIPAEKLAGQNSAYSHRNYEGRFRKRRRPSTYCEADHPRSLVEKTSRNVLSYVLTDFHDATYTRLVFCRGRDVFHRRIQ